MPPRKTYPPASRQSARLNSKSAGEATNDPESAGGPALDTDSTTEQEDSVNDASLVVPSIEVIPDNSNDESYSARTSKPTTPIPTPGQCNTAPEMADNEVQAQLAQIQAELTRLRAENAQLKAAVDSNGNDSGNGRNNARPREATPDVSAFGGKAFTPTGIAARVAFKPYGKDQNAANPDYDRKAKPTATDPGKFGGDKNEFDSWVARLADKFKIDNDTFKNEYARMALVHGLTTDRANKMIKTRYLSETNSYSCVAEMIQVLATAYHNSNQASDARKALAKMMYEPGGKTDIFQFISDINALADEAGIADAERKATLWEHIPPGLDNRLLGDSKDPDISYERFTRNVADAAHSQQRHYELHQERRRKKDSSNTNDPNGHKSSSHSPKRRNNTRPKPDSNPKASNGKPVTVLTAHRALTEDEKRVHWDANSCFICGKVGHKGADCPDREKIPTVKAIKAKERDAKVEETSSADESGNE